MITFSKLCRAPLLVPAFLVHTAHAHPGHSHFGSAGEEPGLWFWLWVAFILALSAYGGWRLYRMFTTEKTVHSHDTPSHKE